MAVIRIDIYIHYQLGVLHWLKLYEHTSSCLQMCSCVGPKKTGPNDSQISIVVVVKLSMFTTWILNVWTNYGPMSFANGTQKSIVEFISSPNGIFFHQLNYKTRALIMEKMHFDFFHEHWMFKFHQQTNKQTNKNIRKNREQTATNLNFGNCN